MHSREFEVNTFLMVIKLRLNTKVIYKCVEFPFLFGKLEEHFAFLQRYYLHCYFIFNS